jgi:DNA-binding transcriptional MerR regulator
MPGHARRGAAAPPAPPVPSVGAAGAGRRLKMRDLERATGVGREAIRFYIREGLLPEPERPARNVALYDESFVERVSLIKRLQHERFLPLAVIKGLLGAQAEPSEAEVRTLLALGGSVGGGRRPPRAPEAVSSLAERVGLPVAELRELARLGAIEIATRGGRPRLEGESVEMAELWAAMRKAGYSAELGFGPGDVALPVQAAEWLAREQLRLFTSRVTGRVDDEAARRMAEVGLACVPRMTAILHHATMLRRIATGNAPDEGGTAGDRGRRRAGGPGRRRMGSAVARRA